MSFLLVLTTLLSCFMLSVWAAPTGELRSDEAYIPFEDVKKDYWFYEAVEFCYANGIINGMNEYTFGFSGQLTRAQFVTMLANLEGVDVSTYTVDKFTDVKSNHWYYGAIAWAFSEGIVSGMTDTTFQPNGVLTRAQLAVVMNNYMKEKYEVEVKADALDTFTDKPKSEYWYYGAMKFAVSAGLLSGNSDGTLAATGNVTRAQAAVIFKSFMEIYYYGDCEHEFSEPDCDDPATCAKCGLVNGLANGHKVTGYNCVDTLKCNDCGEDVAPSKIMHNFTDATCTSPRTCTLCGTTRGEAKGHKWSAATCTAPKTCTVCKATEGTAKGHNFKAATCTEAKVCVVCNTKEGSPLGHTTQNGVCSRCNGVFFKYSFDKAAYYLKTKGIYDNGVYSQGISSDDQYTVVSYNPTTADIEISNVYMFDDGAIEVVTIYIVRNATVYEYYYGFMVDGEYEFVGYGILNPSTFDENTVEGFSDYEGKIDPVFTENMNIALKDMLSDADYILNHLYGGSIRDLGFKVF